jgi:hypothetical protein
MNKNKLLRKNEKRIRVLKEDETMSLIIDCVKETMPIWVENSTLEGYEEVDACMDEDDLDTLSKEERKLALQHYTMIASILPFVGDVETRTHMIESVAKENNLTTQTIRKYLCRYLVNQNIVCLAPKKRERREKPLSQDERNIRWALNKYYYTTKKNSLSFAYKKMLEGKYCDEKGELLDTYPSFYQFRYFYRKYNKKSNQIISRYGLSYYQRNERPLLGDGVQEFAPYVGVGLLDATICDIYLINEGGQIVGRPILTACVDAYSGLCCGYSLSWEGGVYSLRNLMLNVIEDKPSYCKKFGISISKEDWNCNQMLGKLVTDMGREYVSNTFEQLVDLGVTITNLPPYRPELKGKVEKFFDLIQASYKPLLKGKGVIEQDYQERGVMDYRKQACLTMEDFEKVILNCIIFYNANRILENFPYSEEMLAKDIKPYASHIWNDGLEKEGANLIHVTKEQLILTLLPRTKGQFTRFGLKVNKMRYHNKNYNETYLDGNEVMVAYSEDNVNKVWLIENGKYIPFTLIEKRYKDKNISMVEEMKTMQKELVKNEKQKSMQAEIALNRAIDVIANQRVGIKGDVKGIRSTREKEIGRHHKIFTSEVMANG